MPKLPSHSKSSKKTSPSNQAQSVAPVTSKKEVREAVTALVVGQRLTGDQLCEYGSRVVLHRGHRITAQDVARMPFDQLRYFDLPATLSNVVAALIEAHEASVKAEGERLKDAATARVEQKMAAA